MSDEHLSTVWPSRLNGKLIKAESKFKTDEANMFFFVLFIVFLVVITRHFSAEYKLKAIRTGEALLSPVDKSILPFCKVCKIGSLVVFTSIIVSGVVLLIAQTSSENLLSISRKGWSQIHLAVVSMFSVLFIFLTYVHWNWFRRAFTHRVRTVR